jgi:hypothetical protein
VLEVEKMRIENGEEERKKEKEGSVKSSLTNFIANVCRTLNNRGAKGDKYIKAIERHQINPCGIKLVSFQTSGKVSVYLKGNEPFSKRRIEAWIACFLPKIGEDLYHSCLGPFASEGPCFCGTNVGFGVSPGFLR